MVIDAWLQHPGKTWLNNDMFSSLQRWKPGPWSESAQPVEKTLEAMDAAGVERGMMCAWWGPEGEMISNDSVAELCAAHPDRFIGVASVDITRPMKAVNDLRRYVEDHSFRALRIIPWLWGLPPDDRRYHPPFAACCDLDIAFCSQVDHAGPLRASEPGRPIPYLDNVTLEFPDLRIVGGHIGVPWLDEMISLATKYPNVYVDTSAYTCARYPKGLIDYVQAHGALRVQPSVLARHRLPEGPRRSRPRGRDPPGVPARQRSEGVQARMTSPDWLVVIERPFPSSVMWLSTVRGRSSSTQDHSPTPASCPSLPASATSGRWCAATITPTASVPSLRFSTAASRAHA